MKKLLVLGDLSSIHLKKWTETLHDDYEIFGFTFSDRNITTIKNDNIIFYKGWGHKKTWCISAVFSLQRFFRDVLPDVVHVHYASSYGLLGAFLRTHGKVLSVWGSDVNYCQHSWLRRVLMSWTLKSYPVVNCASNALKVRAEQLCNSPEYAVFQYGIDVNIPSRDLLSLTEKVDSPTFLINRGFLDIYRVDFVITEFDRYLSEGGSGTLKIFGYGSPSDTQRVQSTVANVEHPRAIAFHGTVSPSDLFKHMLEANYYISIPTVDGAPLALYEALHIGLYPIVSDIESNRETFKEGHAAFVSEYQEGSLSKVFHSVAKIGQNSNFLLANRNLVAKKYNFQTNIQRIKQIYTRLQSK